MKRIFSALLCLLALTALWIPVYAEDEPAAAEEQPAEEQPAEEQPAEEQPAEEQPAEEQPVEEQPAEEQPAQEQPAEEAHAEEEKEETVQISLDLTDAWAGRAFELTTPGGVSVQEAVSEEGTVTFEAPVSRYYAVFPSGGESPDPPEDIQTSEEQPEAAAEEGGDVTILVYLGKNWAGTVFSARTELSDYPEAFAVSAGGVLTLSLEESTDFWAGTELTETAAAADDVETASKSSDSDEESSDLMVFLYFGGLAVIAICYAIYRLRKRAAAGAEQKEKEEDDEDDDDEYDDEDGDDEYGRFRREDGEDGPWRD